MNKHTLHHTRLHRLGCIVLVLSCTLYVYADTWWIAFKDKVGTAGDMAHPEQILSPRALERREKHHIPIDSLDLPVSRVYTDSICRLGVQLLHTSRWHNGATVYIADNTLINRLRSLDFVDHVQRTQTDKPATTVSKHKLPLATNDIPDYGNAALQTAMLHLTALHNEGFKGAGIHIAVVDNGFYNADQLDCFNSVRPRILATYDFVAPGNDVYRQGTHGTMVLSCMAAADNHFTGASPEASYYLFRTEDDNTESLREMDAQVAAFELADSLGADIITSSLGYAYGFDDVSTDYTYADMDGRTLRNSRAATIAARKGIIVCIAMGNEGNKAWHYLTAPADADSILSVGSVNNELQQSPFSSFGPAADQRIKPDVCALGSNAAIVNPTTGDYSYSNGTSFATPIIAGMTACLWNALPQLSNMQLIERIIQSASQTDRPDDCLGYGIPDAWYAYTGEPSSLPDTPTDKTFFGNHKATLIYNLQGQYMGDCINNLAPGFYILKNGVDTQKILFY